MRRRDFITLAGGAAAVWPLAARAQQAERVRRVGVLMNSANGAFGRPRAAAFQQELQRLGWIDDRNIAVEYRWGEDRFEQFAAIVADFVRLDVDVIVTIGTPATLRAKEATSVIPIVFVGSRDPVRTGLVASLERPGGNITGISNQNPNIAGGRIKLLQDIVPDLSRLAILANANDVSGALEVHDATQVAGALGIDVIASEIRLAEDIAPALAKLHGPALAIYVVADALTNTHASEINALALAARLPTVYAFRQRLESGGLLSFGLDGLAQYRVAAALVDEILRGVWPADIPVAPPAKLELAVNLKTARALGLTVPPTLLSIADKVIE
jgi:putative tryptophan/tyrosine transport system substrate-binding protein